MFSTFKYDIWVFFYLSHEASKKLSLTYGSQVISLIQLKFETLYLFIFFTHLNFLFLKILKTYLMYAYI